MKQKYIKIWLAAFSISTIGISIIYACGGWDYDYPSEAISNFTPEVFVKDTTSNSFFYEPVYFFYGNSNYQSADGFNEQIVSDWQTYLNNTINGIDLRYFLFEPLISADYFRLETKLSADTTGKQEKLKLNNPHIKNFCDVMYFAKRMENYSGGKFNWETYEREVSNAPKSLIDSIRIKYETTKDPFIKNRFWFLTLRAYFYSEFSNEGIKFYNTTEKLQPQNLIYYRGKSYLAGMYYKNEAYATSNYLYACIFNKCQQLQESAMYSFHPQEINDFNQSLSMCKTIQEKTTLWTMLAFYDYGATGTAIEEIYKLDPKSDYLSILGTRMINILESKISEVTLTNYDKIADYKKAIASNVDEKDLLLITKIAKAENTCSPFLWYSAAGYLNTFLGNYQTAKEMYDNAQRFSSNRQDMIDQLRLLKVHNKLFEINKITPSNENILLDELDWLYNNLNNNNLNGIRNSLSSWSKYYLSTLYAYEGNVLFSELFNTEYATNFYEDNPNQELMKQFLEKQKKTAWEKLATSIYNYKVEDIYEYQAIELFYEDKIDEAIAHFKKAGETSELYGNPFLGNIKDCHDCDHAATQEVTYNKLSFLTKMKEYKDNILKGVNIYNNAILVANGFYNASYFGNARVFYETRINIKGENETYYENNPIDSASSNEQAKKYYELAFKNAKNNEQKAKSIYMLTKIERNDFYGVNPYGYYDNYKYDWEGFKTLKEKYSYTKFYKEVIEECGWFKTYVQEYGKKPKIKKKQSNENN